MQNLPRADAIDKSNEKSFQAMVAEHKLSSSEYATLEEILQRTPTFAELGVFSSMWSEHCSYKSSRVHLSRFPTEGEQVVVGPGENAGIVRMSGKLCVAFKMESHNHPSYIEPYQGAATGVGGILRDVFCMGARPVANLNALRFGKKAHKRTPYILEKAVQGIGDYGNCIGVPTVGGSLSFDECYDGNCLVNAMTVGIIEEDKIFKGFASGVGNYLVYLGSATGRDGIHGATMASDSFDSGEDKSRTTIQVGDPFTEKLLLEATLDVLEKGLVVGLQDMGAAGLTSSSFEMAERAKNGLLIELDKVPTRAKNMSAYELLLSESQERMLMVVEPQKWPKLRDVLEKWQLACAVIGQVTDTGRVQCQMGGRLEVDVPVEPIVSKAPKYERPLEAKKPQPLEALKLHHEQVVNMIQSQPLSSMAQRLFDIGGSHKNTYEQYDQDIGTRTVLSSREAGASLLWLKDGGKLEGDDHLGLAVATSCNEAYCYNEPKLGAAHAVLKAAKMISSVGATPLAITDCLNFGNPENPQIMWEFSQAVDGIAEACRQLNTPVVSGNVSLYNETNATSIYPTPMIGMVGRSDDVRRNAAATPKKPGKIFRLTPENPQFYFGASGVAKALGLGAGCGQIPRIDWQTEKVAMAFIRETVVEYMPAAVRDVGCGGLLASLLKMALNADMGLEVVELDAQQLYGETTPDYLLVMDQKIDAPKGFVLAEIGHFSAGKGPIKVGGEQIDRSVVEQKFEDFSKG